MASIDSFSLSDRILSCLPSIAECLPINPSHSSSNPNQPTPELQGLLSNSNDDYDDSDAISLLSNIADSDSSRRNRRRRNRLRREGGITTQLLACGLFGRSKGQIQQRPITVGNRRQNATSTNGNASDDGDESDRGVNSSLRDVDSGDEDAGMLKDDAIAKLAKGKGHQQEGDDRSESGSSSSKTKSKSKRKQKEEEEERKKAQEEADRAALEEDERLALEESRLAQEEEAAVAKARRKAERRAAKAGLLKLQNEAEERRSRGGEWRTEAGAEAAAGGFNFAEEGGNDQEDYDYNNNDGQRYEEYGDYNGEGREDFNGYEEGTEGGYQFEQNQPTYDQQGQVIHHHHHYYNPNPEEPVNTQASNLLSPTEFSSLPALPSPTSVEDQVLEETPIEDDEDEADIAGLSFGKKKRRNKRTESQSGGSGNGSKGGSSSNRQRLMMGSNSSDRQRGESFNSGSHNGSGNGSGNGRLARGIPSYSNSNEREISPTNVQHQHIERPPSSSSSNSSSGRAHYRDKPRRHERTNSRSTNNSSRDGLTNRIQIPNLNLNNQSPSIGSAPSPDPSNALSPNSFQPSNSPNFNDTPSTMNTSPIQMHSSPNLPAEESPEFNYNKLSNAYKSKSRKGSKGGETSSNGSSSAAASRRARGIPAIHEESTTSPQKLNGSNDTGSFGGGLNSSRNPNGANAWSRFNQESTGRKLEEEEVDGL